MPVSIIRTHATAYPKHPSREAGSFFGQLRTLGRSGLQAFVRCERRRRPAARQSRDMDSPARSGAYAASLRDTNSVKSRTRFVLRVSPCVRSQSVPCMCRSVPGTLTSRGSASPTKQSQRRYAEPLPYRDDLRLAVRGPERNPRGANPTLAGPIRDCHDCL